MAYRDVVEVSADAGVPLRASQAQAYDDGFDGGCTLEDPTSSVPPVPPLMR